MKNNLPDHAQDIFREAFNSASEQYEREEQWFAVAWSAVERVYKKNADGDWVRKRTCKKAA